MYCSVDTIDLVWLHLNVNRALIRGDMGHTPFMNNKKIMTDHYLFYYC